VAHDLSPLFSYKLCSALRLLFGVMIALILIFGYKFFSNKSVASIFG